MRTLVSTLAVVACQLWTLPAPGNPPPPSGPASAAASAVPPAPVRTPEQLNARFTELTNRYRSASGAVDVNKMSADDAREYARIQSFFQTNELKARCKLPSGFKLAGLAPPPEGMCSAEVGETEMYGAAVIAGEKQWVFAALLSECMMPLPKGWNVHQEGTQTHLAFPRAEWVPGGFRRDADPRGLMDVQIRGEPSRDLASFYASYKAGFAPFLAEKKVQMTDPTALEGGRGYFVIRSPAIKKLSVVFFAPRRGGEGIVCVANVFEEKWAGLQPVLETMLRHWYTAEGQPIGAEFHFAGIASDTPPTAGQTATPKPTKDAKPDPLKARPSVAGA